MEQVGWLAEWCRGKGALGEWSLLFNVEIALLTLARDAPLEDGRWSGLAFDVECRLGELEAEDPTLPQRGWAVQLEEVPPHKLLLVLDTLLSATPGIHHQGESMDE